MNNMRVVLFHDISQLKNIAQLNASCKKCIKANNWQWKKESVRKSWTSRCKHKCCWFIAWMVVEFECRHLL
jgi:hypothetical protein